MTRAMTITKDVAAAERVTISEDEAARRSGVSAKTLQRATARGDRTGRRRVGRRIVYVVAEFDAWLAALPTAAPAELTA